MSYFNVAGLRPLACWDCGGMDVCCVLSGRALYDELITPPEESYRLWCVVVYDLETSLIRRPWPWPTGGLSRQKQTIKWTPILVAARSKVAVCSRLPSETVGSNPTGCMDIGCQCRVLSGGMRRTHHSSRGVLPTVVRCCAWCRNLVNQEALTLTHWGGGGGGGAKKKQFQFSVFKLFSPFFF